MIDPDKDDTGWWIGLIVLTLALLALTTYLYAEPFAPYQHRIELHEFVVADTTIAIALWTDSLVTIAKYVDYNPGIVGAYHFIVPASGYRSYNKMIELVDWRGAIEMYERIKELYNNRE